MLLHPERTWKVLLEAEQMSKLLNTYKMTMKRGISSGGIFFNWRILCEIVCAFPSVSTRDLRLEKVPYRCVHLPPPVKSLVSFLSRKYAAE